MSHYKFTLVKEKRRQRKEHGSNKTCNHYRSRNLRAVLSSPHAHNRGLHTRNKQHRHNDLELHRLNWSSLPVAPNTFGYHCSDCSRIRQGYDIAWN